jgi:hypothetical protein
MTRILVTQIGTFPLPHPCSFIFKSTNQDVFLNKFKRLTPLEVRAPSNRHVSVNVRRLLDFRYSEFAIQAHLLAM